MRLFDCYPTLSDNDDHSVMENAYGIMRKWKGYSYIMGTGHLDKTASLVQRFGRRALVVANTAHMGQIVEKVLSSLRSGGIEIAGGEVCPGARPNAPKEDVYRINAAILRTKPDEPSPLPRHGGIAILRKAKSDGGAVRVCGGCGG